MVTYPFEKARSVHIQGAAALNLMRGSILAGLLIDHITRHEHGDQVTCWEAALVGLKEEAGTQVSMNSEVFNLGENRDPFEVFKLANTEVKERIDYNCHLSSYQTGGRQYKSIGSV